VDHLVGAAIGDYLLQALIGAGGMGAVYRAKEQRTGRVVAVKLIRPDQADERCRIRFLREARLGARLNHQHIARVFDFGAWGGKRDRYYMAQELVDGVSVEELCRVGIPPKVACGLVHQALDALGHVHARDILHRDIKPENLLVSRDEEGFLRLVITDFGIAAAVGDEPSTRLTEDGVVLGTPAYMAPEHARGLSLDGPGVDLYPMGVILYRLLTGRLPFVGPPIRMMLAKNQVDPRWPETGRGASLSGSLKALVLKMMARAPEHRFGLAPDARKALRPFAVRAWLKDEAWAALSRPGGEHARTRPFPPPARSNTGPTEREVEVQLEPAGPTPDWLWGREREMDTLLAVAREAERGHGRAVLVRGDVGVGKSALVKAFTEGLAEQGRFIVVRHDSVAADSITESIDRWLGTRGREPQEVADAAREFLRRHGEESDDEVQRTVELLRPDQVTGARLDPRARQEAAFALMSRTFRRMARRRPVVLAVEDLHVAGSTAAAFLEHLLLELDLEPFPFLYVGTWRPGAEHPGFLPRLARTDRYAGRSRQILDLEPLPQWTLVEGLTASRDLEPKQARRIAIQAGGNPLFALLLADEAKDDGDEAEVGDDRTRRLLELHLERKLAPLPAAPRAQRVLEALAVLGDRVELGLLEDVLGPDGDDSVADRSVDDLVSAGLLGFSDGGEGSVYLSHALHRPVLLERLGRRQERRLHLRAADHWRLRAGEGDALAWGRAGEHLLAAGKMEEAAPLLVRAVDEELARADVTRAIGHARTLLEQLPDGDERREVVALRLGRLLVRDGDPVAAEPLLTPLLASTDADRALLAGELLGTAEEWRGEADRWRALIDRLDLIAPRAGGRGRAAWHRTRQAWLQSCGEQEAAVEEARAALAAATTEGEELSAAHRVVYASLMAGRPDEARRAADRVDALSGDRTDVQAAALRTRAMVHLWAGELDRAEELLQAGRDQARTAGCHERLPPLLLHLGLCSLLRGDLGPARRHFERSERLAEALARPRTQTMARYRLLMCDLIEGRVNDIGARLLELDAEARTAGLALYRVAHHAVRAWLSTRLDMLDEALDSILPLERMRAWPAVPDAALLPEKLAAELERLGSPERRDLVPIRAELLEIASLHWRRCGDVARADRIGRAAAALR
jgi:tetratricopeptide (TPR) repeat protein